MAAPNAGREFLKALKEFHEETKDTNISLVKKEIVSGKEICIVSSMNDRFIAVGKDLNAVNMEDIFYFWIVKENKFTKKKLDVFKIMDKVIGLDVAFYSSDICTESYLSNIFYGKNKNETALLYFLFPLFEKFHKAYADCDSLVYKIKYKVLKFLYITISPRYKEAEKAFRDIIGDKRLKDVGFSKKKSEVMSWTLTVFLSDDYNVTKKVGHLAFDVSSLNEIERARKESSVDIPFFHYAEGGYKTFSIKEKISKSSLRGSSNGTRNIQFYQFGGRSSIGPIDFLYVFGLLYNKKVSTTRILKYIKEIGENQYIPLREALSLYKDYLNMAYQLYDNVEKFPTRLKTSHDKVAKLYNEVFKNIDEETEQNIKNRYEKIKIIEGELTEELTLVVPKSAKEILNEGHELSHCVGSYIKNVSSNNTTIIFVRRTDKPNKSLYTAELIRGRITQFRGLGNSAPPEEIRDILQKRIIDISKKMKKGA